MTAPDDPVAFAERVLALLDNGSFTTSYKYAVLLGLVDCCVEGVAADGSPPEVLHARDVAGKVLALYWRQAASFPGGDNPVPLRQRNERGKRDLVSRVAEFRAAVGPELRIEAAAQADPVGFAGLRALAEATVIRMPLPKLQRVNPGDAFGDGFLFRIGWPDGVSASRVRKPEFDDRIHLKPGVGALLVRLAGLIRPLVQREWADFVARRNTDVIDAVDLDAFLFGSERVALDRVRLPLTALQDGHCFYCAQQLRGRADVDHFLPWSRCGDDGLGNLVAAHPRCNNRKGASLAAAAHVGRWLDRGSTRAAELAAIAAEAAWPHNWQRTLSTARALYLYQAPSLPLWLAGDRYTEADGSQLSAMLTPPRDLAAAEGHPDYRRDGSPPP